MVQGVTMWWFKELLCTMPVLLQYYKVLQRTTPVQKSITPVLLQYYSVLQSTSPVLLCATKYYPSTTLYYKVRLQYYSGTTKYYSSTSPVLLQCYTTKHHFSTTLYYKVLRQSATQYLESFVEGCPVGGTPPPLGLPGGFVGDVVVAAFAIWDLLFQIPPNCCQRCHRQHQRSGFCKKYLRVCQHIGLIRTFINS